MSTNENPALAHQKHIADLQAVLEVSRELASTDDLGHLVRAVERAARKVLECEQATLLLYDPTQDTLMRPKEAGGCSQHAVHSAIAQDVVRTRQRIELDDPGSDPRFDPKLDSCCGMTAHNLAFYPLLDYQSDLVGVLQVRNLPPLDPWDAELIEVFEAQVGVAVQRHLLLDHYAEKRRIERDLKLARTIQQGLLPDGDPTFEGFDIAGWNQPADDTGGDFWDHHELSDGSLALALADATGHGIGAALMMAGCRSLFRATTAISHDLTEIVDRVNRLLVEDLMDSRSVTAVLGFLEANTFSFLSAGHGPLVRYLAAEDQVSWQKAHGIPLGIAADFPWPKAEEFKMASGDLMVLLTDGFYEWERSDGEEFGIDRILDLIHLHHALPAKELIRTLYRAVTGFVGTTPQTDDLTILVIRKL